MPDPKNQSLIDPDVIARIKGLRLVPRFSERSASIGAQSTTRLRGSSSEFVDYRSYVPGEDPRRIDWKVYARQDRYYLRSFQGETNCTIWILLDASRSMLFQGPLARQNKWLMSCRAALGLCYSALSSHDACALAVFGQGLTQCLPPKASWDQLSQAAHLLESFKDFSPATDFESSFERVAGQISRRAVVVIFSDFLGQSPEKLAVALESLRSRRHDLSVLRVTDPMEVDLKGAPGGFYRIGSMENEPTLVIEADIDQLRHQYEKRWRQEEEQFSGWLSRKSIDYQLWETSQDPGAVLADFLTQRQHRL